MTSVKPTRHVLTLADVIQDDVDPRHDLTGQKQHMLTITGVVGHHRIYRSIVFFAKCDCGKEDILVTKGNFVGGGVRSCGCDKRARIVAHHITHGDSRSDEHNIWMGMVKRCTNRKAKTWKDYGGAGISVCSRWRNSYADFLIDMGRRPSKQHSLDRIDVSGNYEPSNCRWSDPVEQANNTSRTRRVLYNGEVRPMALVCRELGINYNHILTRLYRHVDFLEAVDMERRSASPLKMFHAKKRVAKKWIEHPKHGYSRMGNVTPEYQIWCGIISRCTNPRSAAWIYYGGAGIAIDPTFRDFPTFLKEIGLRPGKEWSVDRIDARRGYEPGNVRWATRAEQANNKMSTVMVEHEGQMVPVTPLCRQLGLNDALVRRRIHEGKTGEDALRPSVARSKT